MSREDLSRAIDQRERIHVPPKPNGSGDYSDQVAPYGATLEAGQNERQRHALAREVARLAVVRLRDGVAYTIELRNVVEHTGYTKREIERLVKPIYEEMAARDAAALGDSARPGQRDEVAEIGQACELFCDADGTAFATVDVAARGHVPAHRETWPVASSRFRRHVINQYRRRYGRIAAGTAVAEGIEGIAATAADGPVRDVFVRVGGAEGRIYLDLCTEDWKVVEIDTAGWRIVDAAPVAFLRPAGVRPLPVPCRDQLGIARLRPLVNIIDEQEWKLFVLWLVGCFRPKGPYPILIVNGEQGSAKTATIKLARRLVDPAKVEVAKPPKSEDDLMIAAKSQWLVTSDNLSSMAEELGDAFCRLATGAGLQTRKLFTNDEQTLIDACRPIALNGIPDIAFRGDFADRTIVLTTTAIADEQRREQEDLDIEFSNAAPAILGALLDGVAAGWKGRAAAAAAMKRKPRMADFAVFAAAAAAAFGWSREEFEAAYEANRKTRVERVVEADPVAEVIHRLVMKGGVWVDWEGTASELLSQLEPMVSEGTRRQRKWPKGPGALSNRLTRAAPGLRRLGITVAQNKSGDRKINLGKTAPGAPGAPDGQ